MDYAIAMIACPRECMTTNEAVAQLRVGGFAETVHVFVEPGTKVKSEKGLIIHRNKKRLGGQHNWRQALTFMAKELKAENLLMVEDDVEYCKGAHDATALYFANRNEPYGYLSLHAPVREKAFFAKARGWTPVRPRRIWGTQAIMFSRDTLERFVEFPMLKKGVEEPYDYIMQQFYRYNVNNRRCFYHVPSLCNHKGWNETTLHKAAHLTNTAKNRDQRKGLDYDPNYARPGDKS